MKHIWDVHRRICTVQSFVDKNQKLLFFLSIVGLCPFLIGIHITIFYSCLNWHFVTLQFRAKKWQVFTCVLLWSSRCFLNRHLKTNSCSQISHLFFFFTLCLATMCISSWLLWLNLRSHFLHSYIFWWSDLTIN